MENLVQQMMNTLIQIALFALLPFVWWLIRARRKSPFLEWLGLCQPSEKPIVYENIASSHNEPSTDRHRKV